MVIKNVFIAQTTCKSKIKILFQMLTQFNNVEEFK